MHLKAIARRGIEGQHLVDVSLPIEAQRSVGQHYYDSKTESLGVETRLAEDQ